MIEYDSNLVSHSCLTYFWIGFVWMDGMSGG